MSFDLSMRSHINTLKKKEFQRGYYMFHSFKNIWTLLTAYKSFVRPLLEYNSVIWNPKLKQDIRALESVQKWFTKVLLKRCNIKVTDYMHRLYMLDLKSLQYRRAEFDIVLVYKIVNQFIDLDFNNFFSLRKSTYNLRGHKFTLKTRPRKSNITANFFSFRTVPVWNALPESIVSAPTLACFKNRLRNFDLNTEVELESNISKISF